MSLEITWSHEHIDFRLYRQISAIASPMTIAWYITTFRIANVFPVPMSHGWRVHPVYSFFHYLCLLPPGLRYFWNWNNSSPFKRPCFWSFPAQYKEWVFPSEGTCATVHNKLPQKTGERLLEKRIMSKIHFAKCLPIVAGQLLLQTGPMPKQRPLSVHQFSNRRPNLAATV